MTEIKLVNFNCPVKLLETFDEIIKGLYGDRTEALCDLMRRYVEKRSK